MSGPPIRNPEDLQEATRVIRKYAADARTTYWYRGHADTRREERTVSPELIQRTLREGTVIKSEPGPSNQSLRNFRYRVRYVDQYGWVDVVLALPAPFEFSIITTIRHDR